MHLLAHVADVLARRSLGVERGGRHQDRRQRRAQIVGDRAQHRCLELVAAPQRGASPRPRPAARRGAVRRRGSTRATGRRARRSGRARPPESVRGQEQRADAPARVRSAKASRCASSSSAQREQRSRGGSADRGRQARRGGLRERALEVRRAEQQLRHLGREVRLLAALLGLAAAGARKLRHQAGRDRDERRTPAAPPSRVRRRARSRPPGGRWKKLKAAALSTLVAMPKRSPQNIDTTTTAQHVQRRRATATGVDLLQRVDRERRRAPRWQAPRATPAGRDGRSDCEQQRARARGRSSPLMIVDPAFAGRIVPRLAPAAAHADAAARGRAGGGRSSVSMITRQGRLLSR